MNPAEPSATAETRHLGGDGTTETHRKNTIEGEIRWVLAPNLVINGNHRLDISTYAFSIYQIAIFKIQMREIQQNLASRLRLQISQEAKVGLPVIMLIILWFQVFKVLVLLLLVHLLGLLRKKWSFLCSLIRLWSYCSSVATATIKESFLTKKKS